MKNVHMETNRSFYDRISRSYDFLADAGEHAAREQGEQALNLQPGESVLEIGFGTGNSLSAFAACVGPEGEVAGVDISPRMREIAEEKLRERGLADRAVLKVGDARQLPFDDEHFDAAFLSFTLELLPPEDIPVALAELQRVLKPQGRLGIVAMSTMPDGEHASMLEKTYLWMHRHFPHIVDCRPIDVCRLLKDAHFKVTASEEVEIWTMPVRIAVGCPGPVVAAR